MRMRTIGGMAAALLTFSMIAGAQVADPVAVASRLEKNVKRFSGRFDRELDKSLYNGSSLEGRLDDRADRLKGAADDVHDKIKSGKEKKIRKELDRALSIAHDVNAAMIARRFSSELERDWDEIRRDFDDLALYYGLEPLDDAPLHAPTLTTVR